MKLPARRKVEQLISSRYRNGERPLNWDERVSGEDIIKTTEGEVLKLQSDGGQSPPKKDWEIIITHASPQTSEEGGGYLWTLYGIS